MYQTQLESVCLSPRRCPKPSPVLTCNWLPLSSLIRSLPSSPSDTLKISHSRAPIALRPWMTFHPLAMAPGPARASASHPHIFSCSPDCSRAACPCDPPRSLQPRDFCRYRSSSPKHCSRRTYAQPAPPRPQASANVVPSPRFIQTSEPCSFPLWRFSQTMLDVCSFFIVTPSPTHLSEGGLPEGPARISSPSPTTSTVPST